MTIMDALFVDFGMIFGLMTPHIFASQVVVIVNCT